MRINRNHLAAGAILGAALLVANPANGFAQGREKRDTAPVTASVTLTKDMQVQIREFYSMRGATGAEALPPGIQKRLARGKPLPPGIAKRYVPKGLRSGIRLRSGYELVEVGLDVLLVEVATGMVHDLLKNVVR